MVVGTDGAAHRKTVDARHRTMATTCRCSSGLAPTDMVITGGAYGLDDGTKVKVGPAADDDAKPAAARAEETN